MPPNPKAEQRAVWLIFRAGPNARSIKPEIRRFGGSAERPLDAHDKSGQNNAVKTLRQWFAVLVVIAAVGNGEAQASLTLLSNLPSNDGGGGSTTDTEQRAVSFTTLSSSFLVTAVTLRLESYESNTDFAQLSIHSNGGSSPGSQIGGTFTAPASSSNTAANFTFTSTGVHLNPNTNYWVVIKGASGTQAFTWNRSEPVVTPPTTSYATFVNQWISYNSGDTWAVGSNGAHSFAIVGVPEPNATAQVLGIALIGMILLRQSRRLMA